MLSLPPRRTLALTALAVAGLAAVGLWKRTHRPPLPPLSASLWYWHHPFQLAPETRTQLAQAGVNELFVHAGLLYRRDDNTIGLTLPQQWRGRSDGLPVHLVFNGSSDLLRHLETLPDDALAQAIAEAALAQRAAAVKVGVRVIGLQCDLDYPTRLLPRYAALLTRLRQKLPGWQLSATLLTSWYSSRSLEGVLAALDFSVPQFYEAQTPRTYADFTPLFQPKGLQRALARAGRRGKPFRAGLPTYGHALVFDAAGRLVGMYRDGGADQVAADPNFHCERDATDPITGTHRLEFVAVGGEKRRYRIVFDLPTPLSAQRALELVRRERPDNCQGIVLFRLPEAGETATLPLPTVAALLRGTAPVARPRVRLRTKRAAAWTALEGGGSPGTLVFVDLINDGTAGSALGPEKATLTLHLSRPGVIEAAPGSFDQVRLFSESPDSPASPLRATGVRWSAGYLAPGTTRTAGPLTLAGTQPGPLTLTWDVVTHDGTTVLSGTLNQ